MDNRLRSKTRLVAIQLVSQHLVNKQDISLIKEDFDKYYRNTIIDEGLDKVQYNVNFLSKLTNYYNLLDSKVISKKINDVIKFDRKFENWDTINKAIVLIAFGELENSDKQKIKIIFNDYIEISKSFVSIKETKLINLILDKLINEKI
tara:strand:- start:1297 stop:1740 length:444 start_codon:yes stop_codon:yes gene_type:complete